MNDKICRVGVIGAGVVGGGVIELLLNRTEKLKRRGGIDIQLTKVAELDKQKAIEVGTPESLWVDDFKKITEDPDIDIVVELIGGTTIAEKVFISALENGKAIVTANKALLAENGDSLFGMAKEKGLPIAFEAAVAGGVPIVLSLREGLIANKIEKLLGIVNGTCNYVLCEMVDKNVSYVDAVKDAQRLGYAETPPDLDVEGIDSGHKLALLSALALESWIDFPQLHIEGISGIELVDLSYADYLGYAVKLLAVAKPDYDSRKLHLSVHPALLKKDHPLASVQGSMNAIALHGDVVQESMFYGRGAGRGPTASAVVSDIVSLARNIEGDCKAPTWSPIEKPQLELAPMDEYRTRYYIRLLAEDTPGILGKVTTTLGSNNVSIASVHQFEDEGEPNRVPISVLTHVSREGDVLTAINEIQSNEGILAKPILIRIEE